MALAPADNRFVYQTARLLATAPERYIRQGSEALRLAEKICESTGFRSPAALDLLAMALAETGQFGKAYKAANNAYRLALKNHENKLAAEIKAREKLYQTEKPYRE
jgi:hypothetical protein